MTGRYSLGELLNEAVRVKPSTDPTEPKAAHLTFADMFWECLSAQDRQQQVVAELNRIMNFLLTQSKRESRVERALWFICFVFGRMLDAADETKRSSSNAFFNTLCDRSQCLNKTVRFRCCQCIRMALEPLPDQPEVDDAIAATVYATLLARLQDRSYDVRTQAILALDRFKVPGDDQLYAQDQVTAAYFVSLKTDPHHNPRAAVLNCLPMTPQSTEAICQRTQDTSAVVRLHAFKVIATKLKPEDLGEEATGDVMRRGLKDESELVQRIARETLLAWFDDSCHEDPLLLFAKFSWESHEDVFLMIVDVLLKRRLNKVETWSESCRFDEKLTDHDLSPHDALFWRTLLCSCKHRGDALGAEVAADGAKEDEAQTLYEILDRMLPASLMEFVQSFRWFLEQKCVAQCRQLLAVLTECFNFTDEGDRQIAADLYQELCVYQTPEESAPEWHAAVIALGRVVWPDMSDFARETMRHCEEMSASATALAQGEEQEESRQWVMLSVEMLRALLFGTRNFFSLGTLSYTVADLQRNLKEALSGVAEESTLRKWIVEGIGICLSHKLSNEEREECLPLIWNDLRSADARTAAAAVDVLCTLAMTHGVRRVDQLHTAEAVAMPFPPLWDCKVLEDHTQRTSLPLELMTLLHWDRELHSDVQTAVVHALCKLLTRNPPSVPNSIGLGENVQCLCPLVALFVYEKEMEVRDERVQQFLRVFLDRYAQSHMTHQYVFRAGFVPILRYTLELATSWRLSMAPVIKFLANLLSAPVLSKNATALEAEKKRKTIAQLNAQLVCLLLSEISRCPDELSASKAYMTALWKVITDMKLDGSSEMDRIQILTVVEHCTANNTIQKKQAQALKAKLDLSEALRPLEGEEREDLMRRLDDYMKQLGTHPFSDDEEDD